MREDLADYPLPDLSSQQSILNEEPQKLVVYGQNRKQEPGLTLFSFQITKY